jgi:death-on-curing protein
MSPLWIEERDVLVLHRRLIQLHGGEEGLRDYNLLASCLARPSQHLAYADSIDIIGLASLYTAGIVQSHPFVDGNKRTGFVIGILFLELNGFIFSASEEEATQAVLSLANGKFDEASYRAFLRSNTSRGV